MSKRTGKRRGGRRPGAGRPAGVSNAATEERRRETAAAIEDLTPKDARRAEYLIAVQLWKLATGHAEDAVRLDALKHLDNRLQGRPRESLEIAGPGGGPLLQRTFVARLASGEEALAPPSLPPAEPREKDAAAKT